MKSTLREFLLQNSEVIERQTREMFMARSIPTPVESELARGIPIFMEQLIETLREAHADDEEVGREATTYGQRLFKLGFTVSELVHGYGSVCSVVTRLARAHDFEIPTRDFEVFNRTLDVAIAESVTAHAHAVASEATHRENERLGALAHELRNALAAAAVSFTMIKNGTVGTRGATANVLGRSLTRMGVLVDRSLAEVRLQTDPAPVPERFRLADALDEIGVTAGHEVERRNLEMVMEIDRDLEVVTDRQFLMSAVANLVQNAIKYTRANTRVSIRGHRTDGMLIIEVEDECGGLPGGKVAELFQPFVRGAQHSPGMGLGLPIAVRSIRAIGGEIRVRDLPGKGCCFVAEVPATLPGQVAVPERGAAQ